MEVWVARPDPFGDLDVGGGFEVRAGGDQRLRFRDVPVAPKTSTASTAAAARTQAMPTIQPGQNPKPGSSSCLKHRQRSDSDLP